MNVRRKMTNRLAHLEKIQIFVEKFRENGEEEKWIDWFNNEIFGVEAASFDDEYRNPDELHFNLNSGRLLIGDLRIPCSQFYENFLEAMENPNSPINRALNEIPSLKEMLETSVPELLEDRFQKLADLRKQIRETTSLISEEFDESLMLSFEKENP